MKKAKKILEGFSVQQSSAEGEKSKLDELRAALNAIDPQRNAVREKIDAVRAQLNELDGERKEQMGSFTDLVSSLRFHGIMGQATPTRFHDFQLNERKAVKAELDAEFDKLRTVRTEFKKQKDEWYQWQNEERNRKRDQYKAQRQAEIEAKLTATAQREREAAEIPAYTDEINEVNALIKFLMNYGSAEQKSDVTTITSSTTNANIRPVDNSIPEGAVALGKKADREEESFLMLGGGKKGKKGRRQGSASNGGAESPKPKAFKLDFETISQFMKLKVEIPVSAADVPAAIEALEEKKKWYQDNSAEQTKKNIEAAEAKIAALKAKAAAGGDVDGAEEGAASPVVEGKEIGLEAKAQD